MNALLHAAHANSDLYDTFWIHVSCIDREGVPERNQRVSQTGNIYFQASRVVVWLGNQAKVVRQGANDEFCTSFWEELVNDE